VRDVTIQRLTQTANRSHSQLRSVQVPMKNHNLKAGRSTRCRVGRWGTSRRCGKCVGARCRTPDRNRSTSYFLDPDAADGAVPVDRDTTPSRTRLGAWSLSESSLVPIHPKFKSTFGVTSETRPRFSIASSHRTGADLSSSYPARLSADRLSWFDRPGSRVNRESGSRRVAA
jgi:hypothetical protein